MQLLRVNTAALQAMASNWSASAAELSATALPVAFSPSAQASAAAVIAAHADVAAFTTQLATRANMHASHVGAARTSYIAGEAQSADELSALRDSTTIV